MLNYVICYGGDRDIILRLGWHDKQNIIPWHMLLKMHEVQMRIKPEYNMLALKNGDASIVRQALSFKHWLVLTILISHVRTPGGNFFSANGGDVNPP